MSPQIRRATWRSPTLSALLIDQVQICRLHVHSSQPIVVRPRLVAIEGNRLCQFGEWPTRADTGGYLRDEVFEVLARLGDDGLVEDVAMTRRHAIEVEGFDRTVGANPFREWMPIKGTARAGQRPRIGGHEGIGKELGGEENTLIPE